MQKYTKQQWKLLKKRRLTTMIKAEVNLVLRKNLHDEKKVSQFLANFPVNNQFGQAKVSVE